MFSVVCLNTLRLILLSYNKLNRSLQPINSYLDISRVPLAVPPRAADAREGSLRMVELVIVSVEEKRGEGLLQAHEQTNSFKTKPPWVPAVCSGGCWRLKSASAWSAAGTYYSEHPHQCWMSSGVQGCIVVRRRAVVVPRLVAFCVKRRSLGIQCTDWLEKKHTLVSEGMSYIIFLKRTMLGQ